MGPTATLLQGCIKRARQSIPAAQQLSIGRRLALCFVIIILSMLASDAAVLWQFHRVRTQVERLNLIDQKLTAMLRVHSSVLAFRDRLDVLADSEDRNGLIADAGPLRTTVLEQAERAKASIRRLPPELQQDPTIVPTLDDIQSTLPAQLDAIVGLAKSGDWSAVRRRLARQIAELESITSELVERVDHEVGDEQERIAQSTRQLEGRIFLMVPTTAVFAVLIAGALGLAITRSITRPLDRLVEGSNALARGDFRHEVNVGGNDELAVVGRAFNHAARQLHNQFEMTLEARVSERTRIARELHDTLLQSFHGLLLRFQTVSQLLPDRPVDAKEKLDSAIDQAAEAITEGRDAVQGLRDSTLQNNDLAMAISTLGEELATDSTNNRPAFRVAVEGKSRNLHPIVRDEIYKIVAEALRNAFRHAQARQIEVEIRYDDEQFRLRVRDDGKGIDPAVLSHQGREGHFGWPGMRERATIMGAELIMWSEVDAGTEVELRVPASAAYATARKSP
jgi:signal transduction histidine kinase